MFKWVGLGSFTILFILIVTILCVRLNTELNDNKLSAYRLDAAIKRQETAEIELENAVYRLWKNQILYKEVVFSDNWKQELEEFKRQNGFYDNE